MTRLLLLWLLWLSVFPALSQENQAPRTLSELRQRIETLIGQPRFAAALWGIKIVSADTGNTLFDHNSGKLLSPASNSKLYTVALALDRLGAEYRLRTSLFAATKPDRSGTLKGDLVLYGRGDPTINSRLYGGNLRAALQPLVASLTNSGVKRIDGDLVADQSYFRGPEFGSGWAWDDMQYYYGAEISALTINDNMLQLTATPAPRMGMPCLLKLAPETSYVRLENRTQTASADGKRTLALYRPLNENVVYVSGEMPAGTNVFTEDVTVHNPATLFGLMFRDALARNGVKLKGRIRTVTWRDRQVAPINCGNLVELGFVESQTLAEIAREVQKPSQNLYTDLLLAQVGEQFRRAEDTPGMTSEELGIRELNRFLAEAGVPPGETIFEEGSGLSRDNLTTANATVALLRFMSGHKCAAPYLAALPVAGVDGTLRNRMKNTAAASNVRAKTGSLRWASSLSGYVTTAAGERLVFSLMLNRYHNSSMPARGDLDAIAVLLSEFQGRSSEAAN